MQTDKQTGKKDKSELEKWEWTRERKKSPLYKKNDVIHEIWFATKFAKNIKIVSAI